jgi:hypothetical protein
LYKVLYDKRQREAEYLPRSWYVSDAESLPWVKSITIKASSALIKERSRGLVFASNCEIISGLSYFDYTIIIAEDLAPEYERIVVIKELMHCYFPPSAEMNQFRTSSQIVLDNHMRAFFGSSHTLIRSAQVEAEVMALWMAIGVITTEHYRLQMLGAGNPQPKVASTMMQKLKIPEVTAKALLSPQFEDEISALLK